MTVPSSAVSIVVVNYRSYEELAGCLAAIKSSETEIPFHTILVDQESDATRVSRIQSEFPELTILANPGNDGFAAGVNRGAGQTSGSYLLVLNPDTVVAPELLHTLATWLEMHPNVAVAGPRILNADGSVQPSARRFPDLTTGLGGRMSWLTRVAPDNWLSRRNLEWSRAGEAIDVDWVSGACMMIRRSAFDEVHGMDERFFLYWEDADLCRRLLQEGYRTVYLPSTSVVHHGSRASRHAAARSLVAFHRSAFRYYWKHGSLVARVLAPVVMVALGGRLLLKLALLRRNDRAIAPSGGRTTQ